MHDPYVPDIPEGRRHHKVELKMVPTKWSDTLQNGMNNALHPTTKSLRKESHQEKKQEKNNHRMGEASISEKIIIGYT